MYVRARSVPVNPGTALQVAVRNQLASLTNRWTATLTAIQRTAWDTYAKNVPLTGTLGDARPINALAMYIRCNVPRLQAGLAAVDSGPATFTLGSLTTPTVGALVAGQTIQVTFANTDAWAGAVGGALLIYTSRPQSVGINFFKGPYRYAGRINGAVVPPTSPATVPSPFAINLGQKVFWQIMATQADGRLTAHLRGSAIVA
jgi:hypothetical protein